MVTVVAECQDRAIKRVHVTGHAGWAKPGADLVCAALSHLLHSCAEALADHPAITFQIHAPNPGLMEFDAAHGPTELEFVRGATAVLLEGVKILAEEHPTNVVLVLR